MYQKANWFQDWYISMHLKENNHLRYNRKVWWSESQGRYEIKICNLQLKNWRALAVLLSTGDCTNQKLGIYLRVQSEILGWKILCVLNFYTSFCFSNKIHTNFQREKKNLLSQNNISKPQWWPPWHYNPKGVVTPSATWQ